MQRVSTNLTLFYKFFIPVFWIVFFGAMTMASFLLPFRYVGDIPGTTFRLILVFIFLSGAAVLWFTLLQLKRVEMDDHFIYVTNYFKNFRYPYHNIDRIEESRFLFFRTVTIHFKDPGSFGRRATFIPSHRLFDEFMNNHPELRQALLGK